MKEPEDMPLLGADRRRGLGRVNYHEEIARNGRAEPEASAGPAPVHDERGEGDGDSPMFDVVGTLIIFIIFVLLKDRAAMSLRAEGRRFAQELRRNRRARLLAHQTIASMDGGWWGGILQNRVPTRFVQKYTRRARLEPSGAHEAVEGGTGHAGDLGDGGLGDAQLEDTPDVVLLAVEA